MSKTTLADDCERLLRLLDEHEDGLSVFQIQKKLELTGETWSMRTTNAVLCALGAQVQFKKVRSQFGKITKYSLRKENS